MIHNFQNINSNLLNAAESNNLEKLKLAINSEENVDTQNHIGTTALICLSKSDSTINIEMIDLLLNNNANPNLKDMNGNSALIYAILRGNFEIVKKLLENKNTNINITNINGYSALHLAVLNKSKHTSKFEVIINLLIEKGININMINNNGQTALHVAAHENNPYAIKILLKSGANADIITYFWNPKGKTAYQLAEDYMFHPHEKPFALMAFHEYDKEMNLAE